MPVFNLIVQVTVSVIAMQVKFSSNSFIFLSPTITFCKIDRKTFESDISGFHFTTFVNILPELRYFKGRSYIQISYESHSELLLS